MARKSLPYKVIGVRPDGKTPPELMSEEERIKYAFDTSVIMAKSIGGRPKKEAKAAT